MQQHGKTQFLIICIPPYCAKQCVVEAERWDETEANKHKGTNRTTDRKGNQGKVEMQGEARARKGKKTQTNESSWKQSEAKGKCNQQPKHARCQCQIIRKSRQTGSSLSVGYALSVGGRGLSVEGGGLSVGGKNTTKNKHI